MATDSDRATQILAEIEKYLEGVGKALPRVGEGDFVSYLLPILSGDTSELEMLTSAFGFPSEKAIRSELVDLLKFSEPSLRPLHGVCAQRFYHLLWRFKFTIEEMDVEWREEALQKARGLLLLVEPYLTAKRPTLLQVRAALDYAADPMYFSESVADPMLFAALRAFEYDELKEPLPIPDKDRVALKKRTLDFIFDYLVEVLSKEKSIDDSSNAWWGVRVGVDSGDERFRPLVRQMLDRFPGVISPRDEIKTKSAVPEIYTRLRTSAYTLSNIQAILERNFDLEAELTKQLEVMIAEMLRVLLDSPQSKNLYLASVQYESLRNYLDYEEFRVVGDIVANRQLSLNKFRPVGAFTCADSTLSEKLIEVKTWLLSPARRNQRQSIVVYGPSSTGKSYLVEQLFVEAKQGSQFRERQVICTQDVDVVARLAEISSKIAYSAGGDAPPLVFLDEADTERQASFFPNLLAFLDKGSIKDGAPQVSEVVLFWGGGKYGSIENLRQALKEKQGSASLQKGFDVFNRAKFKIEIPSSLLRNKNQKLLLGLGEVLKRFSKDKLKVDTSVFKWLRDVPLASGGGVRQFGNIVLRLKLENEVVCVPNVSPSGIAVEVSN